ncbi:MAG: winged helix-turn-helix domain-containing protein [Acidobacteriota bacterium]
MARSRRVEAGHGASGPRRLSAITGGATDAQEFDRLIHERTRLAIVSLLAVQKSASFSELKRMLGVTDGNLSVHARKLEDAGYLRCTKSFADRLPHTEYALTTRGRQALERYLAHMEALIRSVRGA